MRCQSPWSSKTKFVVKPSGVGLRMVHTYCQLNAATIKLSYPLRRIESILNMMTQHRWNVFFKADAANGYWAVPLAPEHGYKTAFPYIYGQYYYRQIGQGFTGAPGIYTRLKDLLSGPIPPPYVEPPWAQAISGLACLWMIIWVRPGICPTCFVSCTKTTFRACRLQV